MNIGWKLVSLAAGAVAGIAAKAITTQVWEKGFKKSTPADKDDLNVPVFELVSFAVVTAAVNTAVTEFTRRKTASWYGTPTSLDKGAKLAKAKVSA